MRGANDDVPTPSVTEKSILLPAAPRRRSMTLGLGRNREAAPVLGKAFVKRFSRADLAASRLNSDPSAAACRATSGLTTRSPATNASAVSPSLRCTPCCLTEVTPRTRSFTGIPALARHLWRLPTSRSRTGEPLRRACIAQVHENVESRRGPSTPGACEGRSARWRLDDDNATVLATTARCSMSDARMHATESARLSPQNRTSSSTRICVHMGDCCERSSFS